MAGSTQPIALDRHLLAADTCSFPSARLPGPHRLKREDAFGPRALLPVKTPEKTSSLLLPHAYLTEQTVTEFTERVLGIEEEAASAFVSALRTQGVSIAEIHLELLGPAARWLGKMWEEDICDFVQVTLGLLRLHQIVRELGTHFHDLPQGRSGCRALMMPMLGDQHSFGSLVVAEFFRHAGWFVRSGELATRDELGEAVFENWFAVVGFSLSSASQLDTLSSLIKVIRRESQNKAVAIMVGGCLFIEHPELAVHIGADATAIDASQAVERAASFGQATSSSIDAEQKRRRVSMRDVTLRGMR